MLKFLRCWSIFFAFLFWGIFVSVAAANVVISFVYWELMIFEIFSQPFSYRVLFAVTFILSFFVTMSFKNDHPEEFE